MPQSLKSPEQIQADKEKMREYQRRWYQENKERKDFMNKIWMKKNSGQYYKKHKVKIDGYREKWRKANLGKWAQLTSAWRLRHFFKKTIMSLRARLKTKKYSLENCVTAADLSRLWHKQKGRCALTQRRLHGRNAHLDHKKSLIDGGNSTLNNVQWVREEVNFAKHRLSSEEFILLCQEVVSNIERA